MRKLIGVAMIALLSMTYVASPEAVRTGMSGVGALAKETLRSVIGAVGDAGTSSGTSGSVQQLPDGSWVKIPRGFVLPTETTPSTTKPKVTP